MTLGVRSLSIGRTAVAACFLIVVADYVQQNSRGKWNAFQGVTFGIGSILAALVIVRLPQWLLERGWDVINAGYVTHFVMVGAAGVSALALMLMLRADGPREGAERQNLWALICQGVAQIRHPGVRLAYCAGFASGANMAVIGTYLSLWTTGHAVASGMDFAQGLALGGVLMVIIQVVSIAAMLAIGVLNDRTKPLFALHLSLVLLAVPLAACSSVDEPLTADTCLAMYGGCLADIEPSNNPWYMGDPMPPRREAVAQAMVDLCKVQYERCMVWVEGPQPLEWSDP